MSAVCESQCRRLQTEHETIYPCRFLVHFTDLMSVSHAQSSRILTELTDPALCYVGTRKCLCSQVYDMHTMNQSKSENTKSPLRNEVRWDGREEEGDMPSS